MIRVLYVDDEPEVLERIKLTLEDIGPYRVDTASSPERGLDMLFSTDYDVILADCNMSDRDGVGFLKVVREQFKNTPFILYSGFPGENVLIEAINTGVHSYLQKGGEPDIHFAELAHIIEQAVERNRVEQEFSRSENRYRMIGEDGIPGWFRSTPEGKYLDINLAFARMYGFDSTAQMMGEITDIGGQMYANSAERDVLLEMLAKNREVRGFSAEFIRRDQKRIWVQSNIHSVQDSNGQIPYFEGTCEDITDRKEAERNRDAALVFAREIIINAGEGIAVCDPDLRFREWNPFMEQMTGYSSEEVLGEYAPDLFPHLVSGDVLDQMNRALAGETGKNENFRFSSPRTRKNTWITITHTPKRDGEGTISGVIIFIHDITRRREIEAEIRQKNEDLVAAEEELRQNYEELAAQQQSLTESERRYRTIIENIVDVYYRTDREGRLIFISPSVLPLLGYGSVDEVLGRPNNLFWKYPDEREQMLSILKERGFVNDYEVTLLRKDGSSIGVSTSTRFYTDENDEAEGVEGIFRDISERIRTSQALIESEEKYRQFVENFHGIAYQAEYPDFNLLLFQGDVLAITGYQEEDFIQRTIRWLDLIHPLDRNIVNESSVIVISRSESTRTLEYRIKHRDGQWRWVTDTARSVADIFYHPGLVQGTIQDCTARKKAEEELKLKNEDLSVANEELIAILEELKRTECELSVRNQELTKQQGILNQSHKALREANRQLNLLSSITRHDILNKITVMNGYLTLIRDEVENGGNRGLEYLEILESVTRTIESQIAFTRIYQDLGTQEPQWIPVNALIATINVPGMITLDTDISDIEIYTDPICGKVFENLLDNTLRHGERVTRVRISTHQVPGGLTIIWEDDGVGIPACEKELIFQRGYGKNTGFGLFLVREILSITGIRIQETGIPGKGVLFEIQVPGGGFLIKKE